MPLTIDQIRNMSEEQLNSFIRETEVKLGKARNDKVHYQQQIDQAKVNPQTKPQDLLALFEVLQNIDKEISNFEMEIDRINKFLGRRGQTAVRPSNMNSSVAVIRADDKRNLPVPGALTYSQILQKEKKEKEDSDRLEREKREREEEEKFRERLKKYSQDISKQKTTMG